MIDYSPEYSKESTIFNIYVLEERVTEQGEEDKIIKDYSLTSIGKDRKPIIHDDFDYNHPERVVDNMKNTVSMGTAPVAVVIISRPEPYFRGKDVKFSKRQRKNLKGSTMGYIELDSEREVNGFGRALNESEMKYFTSELRKKLLSDE